MAVLQGCKPRLLTNTTPAVHIVTLGWSLKICEMEVIRYIASDNLTLDNIIGCIEEIVDDIIFDIEDSKIEEINDTYILEIDGDDDDESYRKITMTVEYQVECSCYINIEYVTSIQGDDLPFLKEIDTEYFEKKIERVWPEMLLDAKLDEIQKDAMKRW